MSGHAGIRPGPLPTASIREAISELADDAIVTIKLLGDDRTYQVCGIAPLAEMRQSAMVDKLELRVIPVTSF